ncbi:processed acidic surface protein [Jeotgalibacillus soli]|uniref:Gram-positive cocci surface proteins LPxTG domain-containing protein n=1 Tax=Jeotgalibacillus soli TaxID=889306 RepID=A0A0C2VST3_9BACL|nr:processed acidic surface protein [Jeotgalibacillus soli]KIL51982.1 hypothetical protein KP78_03520 [Jeotgalibacillus soli]
MKKILFAVFSLFLFIGFYPTPSWAAVSEDDPLLQDYLDEVSNERGFEVTIDDIIYSLSLYEESLENFETVEELSEYLSEVIKEDLSNLSIFYEWYELDEAAIIALLEEHGETLDDYIYIDDLNYSIDFYLNPYEEDYTEEDFADIDGLFTEFDLTDEEVNRLVEHLLSIEEELMSPEVEERVNVLLDRMMTIGDFETMTELTEAQTQEMVSIFEELLAIFQIQADYTLIQDGTETPVSLSDLMYMDELVNASLRIDLYNLAGDFLADIVITGELIGSDIVEEVVNDVPAVTTPSNSDNSDSKPAATASAPKTPKTVKGAELPTTGSNLLTNSAIGALIFIGGLLLFRRVRTVLS